MKLEDGKVVIDEATAVAKIGSVGYDTLAAAIAAAQDGDTVTMLKAYDATSEETITLDTGKKVTLDLGGFELTLSPVQPGAGLAHGRERQSEKQPR